MRIKKTLPSLPELKKGSLLVIKVPPYFKKEYLYEITSAGDKLIRASLFHSPTVRKSWTKEVLQAQFEHGIVRLATETDQANLSGTANMTNEPGDEQGSPTTPQSEEQEQDS